MKKLIFSLLACMISIVAFSQMKPQDSAQSKKYYLVMTEPQINQLLYVIGTSSELSAADAKKYTQELVKQFREIPAGMDSTAQKQAPKKPK